MARYRLRPQKEIEMGIRKPPPNPLYFLWLA